MSFDYRAEDSVHRSIGTRISRGVLIFTDICFVSGDQTRNCTPPDGSGRAPNSKLPRTFRFAWMQTQISMPQESTSVDL